MGLLNSRSISTGIRLDRCSYKFIDRAIKSKCLGILEACREDDIIAPPEHEIFKKLADTDLLIIDDFGVRSLDKQQMLDFMELMEDRHGMKSTIIVSQLPVANWYDMMKVNSTAADAILDRIVHTAQRFELKGDSLRKK